MRQSLHRVPARRNFWNINRDRGLAAARQLAASAALAPTGGIVLRTAEAPAIRPGQAESGET